MRIALIYLIVAIICFVVVAFTYNFFTYWALHLSSLKKERHPKFKTLKGAEPIFLENHGNRAVLLIHGFIGSPADFGRLPKLLYEKGFTVSAPLLPGHGTDPRHFSKTTPKELEDFVTSEYRKLKEQYKEVTLIGFSMGGALSILTALKEKVDCLVLLAPYLRIAHQWYYILPTEWHNKIFVNLIPYVYRPLCFKQINKKESVPYIVDYDFVSLRGADTAIRLGNKALNNVAKLDQSVLIIHGINDRATDYKLSKKLAEQLSQKTDSRFVSLPNTNHMMLWDYDSDLVEKEILAFVRNAQNNTTQGGNYHAS